MSGERLSIAGSTVDCEELAPHLLRAHLRPVAWCLVDWVSEATAALTDLLAAKWGPGLCYQPGVPWADPTRPAVLPKAAVSRILHAATTRVWSSGSDVPDRERVMESLEHGCLPLQFTKGRRRHGHEVRSEALRALLLRADRSGSLAPLSHGELKSRLDTVAAALATGRLERDLAHPYG